VLWLFAQSWLLLSASFLAGAALTWLFLLRPGRRVSASRAMPDGGGPPATADSPVAAVGAPAVESCGAVADPRHPGGARPLLSGLAPTPEFTVKGDADAMLYHAPASPAYRQVTAEVWFRTEGDAQDAGFRPWDWYARTQHAAPPAPAAPTTAAPAIRDGAGRPRIERQVAPAQYLEEGRHPGSAKPGRDSAAPAEEFAV